MATVDGRAFYVFVSLLKKLGIPYEVSLPWEARQQAPILSTRKELSGDNRQALFYEDLTGDELIDSALIASLASTSRKNELLVGIDPGKTIGVAVYYKGVLVHAGTSTSPEETADLLRRLSRLGARYKTVRIGFGNPALAMKILDAAHDALGQGYVFELVDETGTSREHKKLRRDIRAAMSIASRRGRKISASA